MGFTEFGEWLKDLLNMYLEYLKPWTYINYYEEGVLLTFGKWPIRLKSGVYPKLPFFQYCYTAHVKEETLECKPITITTSDGETVTVAGVITYEIHNIIKYVVENNDSHSNMKDRLRAEMSNYLEDINWENIKRKTTKNGVKRAVATKFLDYGVTVKDFDFSDKCKILAYKLFSDGEKANLML